MNNIENLHIKELTIDNYKSLKKSKIELQNGLNIIIGKNGAGKSNLLEFINNYASRDINYLTIGPYLRKIPFSNFSVDYGYFLDNQAHTFSYSVERQKTDSTNKEIDFEYKFTFSKNIDNTIVIPSMEIIGFGKGAILDIKVDSELRSEFGNITFMNRINIHYEVPKDVYCISQPGNFTIDGTRILFNPFDETSFTFIGKFEIQLYSLFSKSQYISSSKEEESQLKKDLLTTLDAYLLETGINDYLTTLTPINQIRVNSNINIFFRDDSIIVENLFIEFLIGNDWLPWSYLSDGTKRLFYLISECISIESGIILVEEPELGIHPHQLFKVMDFLKEQAISKQIIITTHSPTVLDVLTENELSRIIIAEYNKGTKFSKLSEAQITKAKRYMNEVGELSYYWLNSDLEK